RAPRDRIDARRRLVEEQHARLVHDRGAERHALLPAARQAACELAAPALEAGGLQHPLLAGRPPLPRALVDAGKEIEVLVDREIVVERKLLGHVAELLPDVLRTQLADLACQSHLARAGRQQATEHLDRGGLARTVGAEQSEDLAVAHLEIDALDRDEVAECLAQAARADRHRITDRLATVAVRKWRNARLALEAAQDPDERVLERR